MDKKSYLLIDADILPPVFTGVIRAKELLADGKLSTAQAVKEAGISRSAFYKYKDSVRPFNDMLHGRIVTFQILLKDEPGILSGVLNVFAGTGVNILTINQNIPANGCAVVTVNAETSGLQGSLQDLLTKLNMTAETSTLRRSLEEVLGDAKASPGVLKCEILAG